MGKTNKSEDDRVAEGVATVDDNEKLEHSVDGSTTRDDLHDQGVPMLPGSPAERQGPEDALGVGEKRGDYRERIVGSPHTSVPIEGGGEPVTVDGGSYKSADGKTHKLGDVVVDRKPVSQIVPQRPRAEDIGDAEGVKGGVDTDPAAPTPTA